MANILGCAQVIPDSYVMHNKHYNMKEAGNVDSVLKAWKHMQSGFHMR